MLKEMLPNFYKGNFSIFALLGQSKLPLYYTGRLKVQLLQGLRRLDRFVKDQESDSVDVVLFSVP